MLNLAFHLIASAALFAAGAYVGPTLHDWYHGAEKAADRLSGRVKGLKKKAKAIKAAVAAE